MKVVIELEYKRNSNLFLTAEEIKLDVDNMLAIGDIPEHIWHWSSIPEGVDTKVYEFVHGKVIKVEEHGIENND